MATDVPDDEELPASYCPDDETSSPGIEEELPVADLDAGTECPLIDEEVPASYCLVDETNAFCIEEEVPVSAETEECAGGATDFYGDNLAAELTRCLVEYPDRVLDFCRLYSGECETYERFFNFGFQHALDDEGFIFWSCRRSRSF